MTLKVESLSYNHNYKVIGKHPDGRIFAVRHGNVNGLYVVDRNLDLIATLNTTLLNRDANGLGNGINQCVILSSGTMLCWGIYRTGNNQTIIWRSTDTSYTDFEPVFSLPNDITFIEKSVAVANDDTIMCCEYTTNPTDPQTGLWLAPYGLNVWKGTNDGRTWEVVHTRSRIPKFEGDTDFIRHFHAVEYDPYEHLFWITTGDWYGESSISQINVDGTGYVRVIQSDAKSNGQQERTTSLMFTEDYVVFGSDSFYNEDHYVVKINRETRQLEYTDFLPNDCTRRSDKFSHPIEGDYLIMNKSYEKAPTNPGQTELYVNSTPDTDDWYLLHSWEVADLNTVSVMYNFVDNEDGRIFVHLRRAKDDTGINRSSTTAIVDIASDEEPPIVVEPPRKADGYLSIMGDGELMKFPMYHSQNDSVDTYRVSTPDGILVMPLEETPSMRSIRVMTPDGIRYLNGKQE